MIYAQYCKPTIRIGRRATTLQLLVHGISYSHKYWNGLQDIPKFGDPNAWAAFANSQGYPSLAIDRLGIGKSDHPDPLQLVQAPYQAELYHDLIQKLRGHDPLPAKVPNKWSRIVYVGHSYGSTLGTYISAKYPDDADAFLLTGAAVSKPNQVNSTSLPYVLTSYTSAPTYDPVRFPPSQIAPGYYVIANQTARRDVFYSPNTGLFSPALYERDIAIQETQTIGEVFSVYFVISQTYNKPVFVTTGQSDAVFCDSSSGIADCGSGPDNQLEAVEGFYPKVPRSKFATFRQPRAGHCLQQFYTTAIGFVKAQAFLVEQGF